MNKNIKSQIIYEVIYVIILIFFIAEFRSECGVSD